MKKIIQGIGIYIALVGAGIGVTGMRGKEVIYSGIVPGMPDITLREGPDGELITSGVCMLLGGLILAVSPVMFGTDKINIKRMVTAWPAFICWILGVIGLQMSAKVFDGFLGVLSATAGFGMIGVGAHLFAKSKSNSRPSATEVAQNDARPSILYLRSFKQDMKASDSNSPKHYSMLNPDYWLNYRPWTFEELMCTGLQELGPVVALGRPDKLGPILGAYRAYSPNEEWQQRFLELVAGSEIVCIAIGNTPGLLWELQHVISMKDPWRVLLFVPQPRPFNFAEVWVTFSEHASENLKLHLPPELPRDTLAVQFDESWSPSLISGRPAGFEYQRIVSRIVNRVYDNRLAYHSKVHATGTCENLLGRDEEPSPTAGSGPIDLRP